MPHKVRVFMLLLFQNEILTKAVLSTKGWQGSQVCHFCSLVGENETALHLFLKCPYLSQIWFWMGELQQLYSNWHSLSDVMTSSQRQALLLVVSAFAGVFGSAET